MKLYPDNSYMPLQQQLYFYLLLLWRDTARSATSSSSHAVHLALTVFTRCVHFVTKLLARSSVNVWNRRRNWGTSLVTSYIRYLLSNWDEKPQTYRCIFHQQTVCIRRRNLLVAPRFQLNTYGRRAFAVAAPATWNTLSDELRNPDLHSSGGFRGAGVGHGPPPRPPSKILLAVWSRYKWSICRIYLFQS